MRSFIQNPDGLRMFTGEVSGSINPEKVQEKVVDFGTRTPLSDRLRKLLKNELRKNEPPKPSGVIIVITDGEEKVDPRRVQEVKEFMEKYQGNGGNN